MPNVKITTQGFNELEALFRNLPDRVADQVLATGALAGARTLAASAKKDAPRRKTKLSPTAEAAHAKFGDLNKAIKAKLLRKRIKNVRSAIVTRGGAYWGDFVNRGTRYIAANRWYDATLAQGVPTALETMKRYMVAKVTQVSLRAIEQYGANKK